jgi:hypothetical protein
MANIRGKPGQDLFQRDKLESLCRYITRPAVSKKRLALTALSISVKLDSRYNTLRPARQDDDVMFLGGGLTRSQTEDLKNMLLKCSIHTVLETRFRGIR